MGLELDEPEENSGDRLYPKDILNHLLLVWVVEYIPESPTKFTKPGHACDAIVVDVVDLDLYDEDGQPGLLARKTWWRQSRLIRDLKARVGKPNPILVRMGKANASMGMNAPFAITTMSADPGSVARANNWYAANPDFRPSEVWKQVEDDGEQWASEPQQPQGQLLPPPRPPAAPSVLEQQAAASQLTAHQQGTMSRLSRMAGSAPIVQRQTEGEPPF